MDCASVALVCQCLTLTLGSSLQPIFIQTSTDLQLTVTKEVQKEDLFFWKFKNNNIVRLSEDTIVHNDYKDRVEFVPQNLSLILKSVQLSDSGIYTAEVSGDQNEILSTFDVRVEAPVSPVLLSVDSVFNSPESCNFTVSCRTELSPSISRSFTCNRHTCEEASPAPSDPAPSVHLYLSDTSIICNHSNHVSWRNDTMKIPCRFAPPPIPLIVGIVCGLGAVVVGGAFLYRRRQKNKTANTMNASYEVSPVPPAPQPEQSDADPPNTTYSLVGRQTGPASPPRPDDVYAQVNKTSTRKT